MKIGFIGGGKVGISLGMYFLSKGNIISYYHRKGSSISSKTKNMNDIVYYRKLDDIIRFNNIVFITTKDDIISDVIGEISNINVINNKQVFIHTSGSISSHIFSPLADIGCGCYSLHPLMTFSDHNVPLHIIENTSFTLEGNKKNYGLIKSFLKNAHINYYEINPDDKILYHAAACIMCNYLVTLLDSGYTILKEIGFDENFSKEIFKPLINTTLDNIYKKGCAKSLTGPISRGDEKTIQSHINAISKHTPEYFDLYKTLGISTIEMIKKEMNKNDIHNNIIKLLRGE
ncbi:MAG: Rossmann-like and DUF2520 domain-containing protein [Eubacteriaceae bacterium]